MSKPLWTLAMAYFDDLPLEVFNLLAREIRDEHLKIAPVHLDVSVTVALVTSPRPITEILFKKKVWQAWGRVLNALLDGSKYELRMPKLDLFMEGQPSRKGDR